MSNQKEPAWMTICPTMGEDLLNWPGRIDAFVDHYNRLGVLKRKAKILSIGAGQGDVELEMVRKFNIQIGIAEPNEQMILKLREKFQCLSQNVVELTHNRFQEFETN